MCLTSAVLFYYLLTYLLDFVKTSLFYSFDSGISYKSAVNEMYSISFFHEILLLYKRDGNSHRLAF